MGIELVPLCTVKVTLAEPILVGEGPAGLRLIYEVLEGTVDGERLRGTSVGRSSADWVTLWGTVATVDVRATFKTHDDAVIFTQYRGRTDVSGGPIYVAPQFETADPRYAWLNAIQAIGKGTLDGSRLTYEWFEAV